MSQKTGKRSRRLTDDEGDTSFKAPNCAKKEESPKIAKQDMNNEKPLKGFTAEETAAQEPPVNGDCHTENGNKVDTSPRIIQTRSRSSTPLIKSVESAPNGVKDSPQLQEDAEQQKETAEEVPKNGAETTEDSPPSHNEPVEMEPLVLLEKEEEEAMPELQFDENDMDVESEGSPSRCKTRRSQIRTVSTPKTPKVDELETEVELKALPLLPEEETSEGSPPKKTDLNGDFQREEIQLDLDTSDTFSTSSTDNWSTRAVAGGDNTRTTDFTADSGLFEENTTTCSTPTNNLSFGETVRGLSSRRTIRPIAGDYRRIAMKNYQDSKRDLYVEYESVERISTGLKRKHRSQTPDNLKRLKMETAGPASGLLSYISSPFSNIKSTFHKSSHATPKLIGFELKEDGFNDGFEAEHNKLQIGKDRDGERKWCAIM